MALDFSAGLLQHNDQQAKAETAAALARIQSDLDEIKKVLTDLAVLMAPKSKAKTADKE